MIKHLYRPVAGMFLLILLTSAAAQALEVDGNRHALNSQFDYLEDPSGELTLQQILAEPEKYRFIAATEEPPGSSFIPTWVKLKFSFSSAVLNKSYYLITRAENYYDIRLYRPQDNGSYRETVTGNDYPAQSRELPTARYGFLIEPGAGELTLYLRLNGGPGTSTFPWDLVETGIYQSMGGLYYSFEVAALSAIAAMLLFNLCIALTLRTRQYFYYCAYVFSVMMALITVDGQGFLYLWPDYPTLNERALHSFNLVSASMRLLTIMSFIGLAAIAPRLQRISLAILSLLLATLILVNLVGVKSLPPYTATIPWAVGILYGFGICAYAIYKKVPLAIPLCITLVLPSAAAVAQAFITVNNADVGIIGLQLAKIGFVMHVLMFSLCLAAHIRIETRSRVRALHDSLTRLPTNTLLQEHFDLAANLCRRQGKLLAVLFIDLDGFKAVNDGLGHAAGDKLLIEVARRLKEQLRASDTAARIGGDEFVVLLTQVQEEQAVDAVAEKLLIALAEPVQIDSRPVQISASIGIAMFPGEGEDLQSLLKTADAGMYAAKHKGKNTYQRHVQGAAEDYDDVLPTAAGMGAA